MFPKTIVAAILLASGVLAESSTAASTVSSSAVAASTTSVAPAASSSTASPVTTSTAALAPIQGNPLATPGQAITIITPYTNSTWAVNSSVQVTWFYNATADLSVSSSTPITFRLQDLRKGVNKGVVFKTYSNISPMPQVGDLKVTLVIPDNTPSGLFAFSVVNLGSSGYISSPPFYVGTGPSAGVSASVSGTAASQSVSGTASASVSVTTGGNAAGKSGASSAMGEWSKAVALVLSVIGGASALVAYL